MRLTQDGDRNTTHIFAAHPAQVSRQRLDVPPRPIQISPPKVLMAIVLMLSVRRRKQWTQQKQLQVVMRTLLSPPMMVWQWVWQWQSEFGQFQNFISKVFVY